MRRVNEDDAEQLAGHDSFLDVVTNIVGILILLVMVVGLRSSQAVATAVGLHAIESTEKPPNADDLREAQQAAIAAERDARELVRRMVSARDESILRDQERTLLATIVAEIEQEIAERRARLSTQDQRDFDLRRKLVEAQAKLESLTREQVALMSRQEEVEEIECEPTPLGRIVKGREVHVLLADDHLAVVPFEELLELMKQDVTANAWRLRQEGVMERTIGPVGGFRLRYTFTKAEILTQSHAGSVTAGAFSQFSHCHFLPITTPLGEPAAEALQPRAEFSQFLRRTRPGTTVTIWTYPGNYDRLREVKRAVREFGLPVAVRPLPPGMPIGASRYGSESVSD